MNDNHRQCDDAATLGRAARRSFVLAGLAIAVTAGGRWLGAQSAPTVGRRALVPLTELGSSVGVFDRIAAVRELSDDAVLAIDGPGRQTQTSRTGLTVPRHLHRVRSSLGSTVDSMWSVRNWGNPCGAVLTSSAPTLATKGRSSCHRENGS
jgi:hypothetical protein